MLYLYQSNIYYLEQKSDDTIMIYTNDGREIEIKATIIDYDYNCKLKITEKESEE